MDKASITSLMSAFGRAYHAEKEQFPIFNDYFAEKLLGRDEYDDVKKYILSGASFFIPEKNVGSDEDLVLEIVNNYLAATPLCRAAYAEKALASFLARYGDPVQYVILGAGLDSFAYRNPDFMARNYVFEVDHPATQADKLERIARLKTEVPDNLRFVPVDFTRNDLIFDLIEKGFDREKKSFFSWLGVTYYLTEEDIEKNLGRISELCSPGSRLVFDYPCEDYLTSTVDRVRKNVMLAAAGGEPMKCAMPEGVVKRILAKYGFSVIENLSPEDIDRDIISGKCKDMKAFECVNYVLAEKRAKNFS